MKKIIKIFLVAILCLSMFLLVACANNEKYIGIEGRVVDKEYEESFTTLIFTGQMYMLITHPAQWILTVEYKTENGIEKTEYEVSETIFNLYEIGDLYIYMGE